MKNKMFIEILNDFLINIMKFINKNFKILFLFIYLCFNVFMIFNYNGLNKITWILIEGLLFLISIISFKFDDEVKKRNKTNKIPYLKKRLTFKIDDEINIMKEDWPMAVLYLSNVEDYLEEVGLLK